MRLRTLVYPVVAVAALGALGVAGYRTRERWVPVVFPAKAPAPAEGGHAHGDGHDHAGHSHDKDDHEHAAPAAERAVASPRGRCGQRRADARRPLSVVI